MTFILPVFIVLIWMRSMFFNDKAKRTAPSRRVLTLAGVATLAFSLVISIGPAFAAANAGTVKIHDATTNLEAGETGNEPHVCSFWVGFYTTDAAETGDWQIVSWPPTGDGTVVTAGDYDTSGDGSDATDVLSLAEGHYRLEWQGVSDRNSKHKTFWVECEVVDESVDPSSSEDPAPSDEESPSQESSPSEEASPSDEESPSDEPSPSEEVSPSQEESPSQEPEGEVKGGNSGQPGGSGADNGNQAPGRDGPSALPDTSTPTSPTQSGVLATIGVLLILAAHAGTRRERTLPSA